MDYKKNNMSTDREKKGGEKAYIDSDTVNTLLHEIPDKISHLRK
jgi:hypothetical protein